MKLIRKLWQTFVNPFPKIIEEYSYCVSAYLYYADYERKHKDILAFSHVPMPVEGKILFNHTCCGFGIGSNTSHLIDGLIPAIRKGTLIGLYEIVGEPFYPRNSSRSDLAYWDDGKAVRLRYVKTVKRPLDWDLRNKLFSKDNTMFLHYSRLGDLYRPSEEYFSDDAHCKIIVTVGATAYAIFTKKVHNLAADYVDYFAVYPYLDTKRFVDTKNRIGSMVVSDKHFDFLQGSIPTELLPTILTIVERKQNSNNYMLHSIAVDSEGRDL